MRRLPQFKGTKDEDFLTWFEDFKLTSERTCSNEEERLAIFKTYLAGDARHVYEGFNVNEVNTFDKAGAMMNDVFALARDRQEWILHLRDLKKKEPETIRVFAYRTARIVRQAYPQADNNTYTSLSIDYFTRGLPEAINSYVIIRKPVTLDLAIKYADIAEKQESPQVKADQNNSKPHTNHVNSINQVENEPYKNDTNNRFKQITEEIKVLKAKNLDLQQTLNTMQQTQTEFGTVKNSNPNINKSSAHTDKFEELLTAIQRMEKSHHQNPNFKHSDQSHDKRNLKRCYNCGKSGHVSENCFIKDNRNCYNCGKRGHISRDCYVGLNKNGDYRAHLKEQGVNSRSRN